MTSRYEDELWSELVAKQGEATDGEHPPASPWRPRGPWAAVGGVGAVAAAAAGAVFAYSAISAPTPAYAVARNHDGSYKIYLRQVSGIKGLNAKLKAMRVPAQAVLLAGGCPPSPALAAAVPRGRAHVNWTIQGRAVLRPAKIQARIHLLLVRRSPRGKVSLGDVIGRSARGVQVPACVNQVRVALGKNGGPPRAVLVRPLGQGPGPATCMPRPGVAPAGASTTATATTATATTSGATTTSAATTPAPSTTTTGATTTAGAAPTAPPLVVRCCRSFGTGGGGAGTTATATATSGDTTTSAPTTTSGGTTSSAPTTTSGATATVTTAPTAPPAVNAPAWAKARAAGCQVLHPRIAKPGTATATGGASTSTSTSTVTSSTSAARTRTTG